MSEQNHNKNIGRKIIFLSLLILLNVNYIFAQKDSSKVLPLNFIDDDASYDSLNQNKINWNRALIAGGSIAALNAGLWIYYNKAFYSGTKSKFHFQNDWYNYTLNIDKLGHFHSAISLQKFSYKVVRWANFSESESMWIASGLSWLHLLQVEISDAFHVKWGFSIPDFTANTLGAVYPNLQHYFPGLKPINFKVSYYPSHNFNNGNVEHIIEDYEGRKYWLTIALHEYLPANLKDYWPGWLNIAVGYGGSKLIKSNGNYNSSGKKGLGEQEWFIGFDYNLLKIFNPDKNSFWYQVLDILNLVHFPSPAIRIKPSTIYYGLYF